jgi:HAD superfamily hydrolase (TIGR01509 family)
MSNEEKIRPAAVIFDMDGTLFDTENLTIPFWEIAGKPFGYNITHDIVLKMVGISAARAKEVMAQQFGADFPYDAIRDEFRKIFKNEVETNGVPKKPGADSILERLSLAKIPMALATSTRRETAVFMLEKAGILDRFSAVTGGDEVVNGKPAPEIFLKSAEKLGKLPAECIGIEDSPAGLLALNSAGIRSIFIKDVIEPSKEVLDTVWRHCGDLGEAARLFDI